MTLVFPCFETDTTIMISIKSIPWGLSDTSSMPSVFSYSKSSFTYGIIACINVRVSTPTRKRTMSISFSSDKVISRPCLSFLIFACGTPVCTWKTTPTPILVQILFFPTQLFLRTPSFTVGKSTFTILQSRTFRLSRRKFRPSSTI